MQKLFTEFEVPKKVIYIIAVRPDDPETCECAVKDCKTKADETEYDNGEIDVYQCDCCCQWFCIMHINPKSDLCGACEALPLGIRGMIIDFREELNR